MRFTQFEDHGRCGRCSRCCSFFVPATTSGYQGKGKQGYDKECDEMVFTHESDLLNFVELPFLRRGKTPIEFAYMNILGNHMVMAGM